MEPQGDKSRQRMQLAMIASAGAELGGTLAVLTIGGWWLDGQLGTAPGLLLTGAGIGIVGGLYKLWRIAQQIQKRP